MRYLYIVGRATTSTGYITVGVAKAFDSFPSLKAMLKEIGGSGPIIISWQELTEDDFDAFVSEPVDDL